MPTLHNCHTHIFTTKNVPDDYFPMKLKDILARRHTSDFVVKLLHDLNPSDDNDRWDHLAAFLDVGNCDSQLEIFELMAERPSSERAFSVGLRAFLGEQEYWQITETNPQRLLFR